MLIKYAIGLAALTGQLLANYCIEKDDPTGLKYNGTMKWSKSKLFCQNWAEIEEYFAETDENKMLNVNRILFNHNYCRNPESSSSVDNFGMEGPWCWVYTNTSIYSNRVSQSLQFIKEPCAINTCAQYKMEEDREKNERKRYNKESNRETSTELRMTIEKNGHSTTRTKRRKVGSAVSDNYDSETKALSTEFTSTIRKGSKFSYSGNNTNVEFYVSSSLKLGGLYGNKHSNVRSETITVRCPGIIGAIYVCDLYQVIKTIIVPIEHVFADGHSEFNTLTQVKKSYKAEGHISKQLSELNNFCAANKIGIFRFDFRYRNKYGLIEQKRPL